MAKLNVDAILDMFEEDSRDDENLYGFEEYEINREVVKYDIR